MCHHGGDGAKLAGGHDGRSAHPAATRTRRRALKRRFGLASLGKLQEIRPEGQAAVRPRLPGDVQRLVAGADRASRAEPGERRAGEGAGGRPSGPQERFDGRHQAGGPAGGVRPKSRWSLALWLWLVTAHDWAGTYRQWAEDLQWSPAECAAVTTGQWWALFVSPSRRPVDWDRLRRIRDEQRAQAGKPPLSSPPANGIVR